jgi:glycosyltransferase involved in cell wall biosynthesis
VVPGFYSSKFLRPFNIPVIGVIHSFDEFYLGVISKFIHGKNEDQLAVSVAVSNFLGDRAKSKETSTQIEVIPCGTPLESRDIASLGQGDFSLKVVYAGRLEVKQKQILKLVDAFIQASSISKRLQFALYGDGSFQKQVLGLIEDAHTDQVHYRGAAKPSEMLSVMAEYQVFTLMSDYEGMPVALMEAMACGLVPVCLEEVSGVNEIINHGVNGFIVKDRHQDYQKHLQILLDDPDLWRTMSQEAIRTIEESYSNEVTHKKWYDLLSAYQSNQTKKVKIPFRIKLNGELLHYGDNRKPPMGQIWSEKIRAFYMKLRLLIRPRARIREWLGK